MRKKKTTEAPVVEESTMVEEVSIEQAVELEVHPEAQVNLDEFCAPEIKLSNIQKQCGLTLEDISSMEYSPSVELRLMFADIMDTMHNYHMSCESKNQSRYNDIMNHILTSCQLVNTFVK
jgi:hypothetical protein